MAFRKMPATCQPVPTARTTRFEKGGVSATAVKLNIWRWSVAMVPASVLTLQLPRSKTAIVGIEQAGLCATHRGTPRRVADAVRPGIVRLRAEMPAEPLLNGQDQPVVAGRTAGIERILGSNILPVLRPL